MGVLVGAPHRLPPAAIPHSWRLTDGRTDGQGTQAEDKEGRQGSTGEWNAIEGLWSACPPASPFCPSSSMDHQSTTQQSRIPSTPHLSIIVHPSTHSSIHRGSRRKEDPAGPTPPASGVSPVRRFCVALLMLLLLLPLQSDAAAAHHGQRAATCSRRGQSRL